MEIKSINDNNTYQECLERIDKINEDKKPEWGVMSAAQMFAHCAETFEVMNGKELANTPFIAKILKGAIRNAVVNNKPYPKSSRTHPQYLIKDKKDFEIEKKRLKNVIEEFVNKDKKIVEKASHPLFGEMSPKEKGWSMYKHLDHHLAQFGV